MFHGVIPPVSESLAAMPQRWRRCLGGVGEIDLRSVRVLAEKHELKMQTGVFRLPPWAFHEQVIDMKSLLASLRDSADGRVHLGRAEPASVTIYAAGLGNEAVARKTQRRPLRLFMVRPSPFAEPVYCHWLGVGEKPMMTVTTHYLSGEMVLYLGGGVAELAVGMSDGGALEWAARETEARFPGHEWKKRQWAIHDVDRAEPENGGKLPDGPRIEQTGNVWTAWPSKLALAPVLADMILDRLGTEGIRPSGTQTALALALPVPPIAAYPWETACWRRL